jgi:hypothetical protein
LVAVDSNRSTPLWSAHSSSSRPATCVPLEFGLATMW